MKIVTYDRQHRASLRLFSAGSLALGLAWTAAPMLAADVSVIGRYETGNFASSAVEMIAVGDNGSLVFVLDASDLSVKRMTLSVVDGAAQFSAPETIAFDPRLGEPTAIAASSDALAVAFSHGGDTVSVAFASLAGDVQSLTAVPGDYLSKLAFSPDGTRLVGLMRGQAKVSGSGLPGSEVDRDDPPGAVVILTGSWQDPQVQTARFAQDVVRGTHPFRTGIGTGVSETAEPREVTFDGNDTAWIALTANNAVARLDLRSASIVDVFPLGARELDSGSGADLIPDGHAEIAPAPFSALHMPVGIAVLPRAGAEPLILTANGGDDRDSTATSIERAEILAADVKARLIDSGYAHTVISKWDGDIDADGRVERPYLYGSRSLTAWLTDGTEAFSTDVLLEKITAEILPAGFNASSFLFSGADDNSATFGPEPSAVAVVPFEGQAPLVAVALKATASLALFDAATPDSLDFIGLHPLRSFDTDSDPFTPEGLHKIGAIGPVQIEPLGEDFAAPGSRLILIASQMSGSIDVVRIAH